jgi:peptidoglycan hydrolase CwlO-like protein
LVPGALVASVVLLGQAAHADSVGDRLSRARETRQQAESTVRSIQARLERLQARLAASQSRLDRATTDMLAAHRQLGDASIRLDIARDQLTSRVRAAYEYGPATALSLYLSAQSPGDLASVNEFTSRVVSDDMDAVNEVENAANDLRARQRDLSARRANLARQQAGVRNLLDQMRTELAKAEDAARRADLEVSSLERQRQALQRAQARETARQGRVAEDTTSGSSGGGGDPGSLPDPPGGGGDPGSLPDPPGFDQAHLLSLLGPTGGRTCSTPPGLRDTGQRLSGKATWYGPGFAGRRTASGAIFDPRLFTAAHRTLPFGTFVRVHYRGKCAIVLINDRGPFIYDRILDLSQAAGQYLGIGVSPVTADILVPA